MMKRCGEIFLEFCRLGLTSFGGPSAHIAFFRDRFVGKTQWLDEKEFAAFLALTQFLPGPGSSQLGMAIGWKRGGILGSLAAFLGFTLPSAIVMVLFALGVMKFGLINGNEEAGWIRGLQIAVIVVIANAVWSMAKSLCKGKITALIALVAAGIILGFQTNWNQIAVIGMGALVGCFFLREKKQETDSTQQGTLDDPTGYGQGPNRVRSGTQQGTVGVGVFLLILFFGILAMTPWMTSSANPLIQGFGGMYRSGSFVFGGGHVVLPLLSRETVDTGWMSDGEFSAGYGAVQAVPGPIFTISTYLGSLLKNSGGPLLGALVCTIGIFLPGWLLTMGCLPFWEKLRTISLLQGALAGTNAAVVGLLGAALYQPVWTKAVRDSYDVIFLLGVAALLLVLKLPPWLVMILAGVAGGLIW